jgi:hypothetical protein
MQAVQFVVQTNSSVRFFKGSYQDPTTHAALPLQVAVEAAFTRLALQRACWGHISLTTTTNNNMPSCLTLWPPARDQHGILWLLHPDGCMLLLRSWLRHDSTGYNVREALSRLTRLVPPS